MQQEEGIIVLLAIALLSICYFSPLTSTENFEGFANILTEATAGLIPAGYKNPQGSIGTVPNSFHPGSAVSRAKWKPGNMENTFNSQSGTVQSLNMTDVQASFPYMEQSRSSDNEKIQLIKPDGVVIGGYLPQILRPFDNVTAQTKDDQCNWPCYSDLKHQKWCNKENAVKYYGMRPLMSPSKYNHNLKLLFNRIIDRNGPSSHTPSDDKFAAVFCTESQDSIMSWLMQKIALEVDKMPEMQQNGPWKTERFYETDVQLYQFVGENGQVHFKVLFNLYNPLRSVATWVQAAVYVVNGKPLLKAMDFVNDGEMGDYMAPENDFGPINGQNISNGPKAEKYGIGIEMFEPLGVPQTPEGMQMWEDVYKKDPNEFDWNYQNTLEVQKFNKYGFYSNVPGDNVEIKGGVPESLKSKLKFCKEENLMSCSTPGFNGVMAVSARALNENSPDLDKAMDSMGKQRMGDQYAEVTPLNGNVKNVFENPRLIYSVPTLGLRDSKIDGMVQQEHVIGKVNT